MSWGQLPAGPLASFLVDWILDEVRGRTPLVPRSSLTALLFGRGWEEARFFFPMQTFHYTYIHRKVHVSYVCSLMDILNFLMKKILFR